MQTLYLSEQGCYVSLKQETLLVKRESSVLMKIQLPLLEQVLVFGQSQLTTQVIRACLSRDIPIAYLSRLGYCYGRLISIERGYRQLALYQRQLSFLERLSVAQRIVQAKLKNCRVLLLRQQRRSATGEMALAIASLNQLAGRSLQARDVEELMGLEGAGAAAYFRALGACFTHKDFTFVGRSRRPPGNPVNALLSFGYQVLWNHLLTLIELQNLDPYQACLHQGSERHAALVSDLVEEFRAPIIDSLVLQLLNGRIMEVESDFEPHQGGCYLSSSGRKKFLQAFRKRMEDQLRTDSGEMQPRWDTLNRQVKAYRQFIYSPVNLYSPYRIR